MTEVNVLRVFLGPGGTGGNPLGVVLDGASVAPAERQAAAAALGYSETVFVDEPDTGAIRIFTPASELDFAGHPTVGTAWLLGHAGHAVEALRPPAGTVPTWTEGELVWVRARAEWVSPMTVRQYGSAAEIDALTGAPDGVGVLYAWAWEDEAAGAVRSRMFGPALGIVEDEATGAAAVLLTAQLGRPLRIRQGAGSLLLTRPGPDGTIDLGGQVCLDGTRPLPTAAPA
jgi:predicted PhzF superfamily epimerase YddE/YHI9